MKIQDANTETGYQIVYEIGDKIKVVYSDSFHIKEGDTGRVTETASLLSGQIIAYEVQLDGLSSSWGHIEMPGHYFKPYSITRAKLPELIREWKQNQVRELIGA